MNDASGNKVQKQVMEDQQLHTIDYLGGFQYLDGELDFIPHAEGYVKAVHVGNTTEYHYVYNYTDHLGNIRLSYGRDPQTDEVAILKESHYYPFGLKHQGYVSTHKILDIGMGTGKVELVPVRNYLDDSYRYTFGGKEEQPELGLNWLDYHARNYDAALGRWMNVDPLADETMQPYSFANNNPLRFTDPTGMAAEEWVNKDGKYFYDDRVVDQASAEEHHGDEASHVGVNKTVSTVVNGEKVDSVTLNEDGSVTKNGETLSANSAETFTNEYGSTFQPRQTVEGYWQVSAGFAFFEGFGASFGKVYDAVGDSKYYFNIDGNIGYGAGANIDGGIAVPTGSKQFLADDFGGNSGSYNAGLSIPGVDANFHRGGSVRKEWSGREKININKFGDHKSGYKTIQGGIGIGAGGRVGGFYSYGTTKVF